METNYCDTDALLNSNRDYLFVIMPRGYGRRAYKRKVLWRAFVYFLRRKRNV